MKKIYNTFCKVEKVLAMTGILLMTISIFLGAVSRAIGTPFAWTTDFGTFMLAWATFLGGDIAFREGRLANLDVLYNKLPMKGQKTMAVIIYTCIIVFLICQIYFGAKLTYTSRFRTFNGIYGFSYSWVTLCMPVSGVFMLVTALGRFVRIMKTKPSEQIAKI